MIRNLKRLSEFVGLITDIQKVLRAGQISPSTPSHAGSRGLAWRRLPPYIKNAYELSQEFDTRVKRRAKDTSPCGTGVLGNDA
jgi:hypothetical protein